MPPKKGPDISTIIIPVWAKPGKAIWVEIMDKEEIEPLNYAMGRIDQVFDDKKQISIIYDGNNMGGEKIVFAHRVLERAEEPTELEDLVDVDPLNDAELLRCLEMRFKNDNVYCYCGPTLLAMNPYKHIAKSGLEEHKVMFRKYALNGGKKHTLPHIWNLAGTSFWQLFDNQKKQAICISGESGAGKTVGTKLCMSFITSLFENEDGAEKSTEMPIEDKILDCNPIMESFGNSKTVRNDNSSRFGKYFIMYVDKNDKHIKGAEIKSYLLEKSRIITQAPTERNYHVFYGIMRFMDKARLKKYGYCNKGDDVDMTQFNYLKKSGCFTWETIDDKEFFNDTASSFARLGFSQEEQDAVYKMLATTLNLGNVEIDASTWKDGDSPATVKDSDYLERVVNILEVDKGDLIRGFSIIRRVMQEQVIESPRTPSQTEGIRDALAKDLFNNVFLWIVRKLNLTLLPANPSQYTTVGLLDIFGFEDFNVNSIEQFCINYTNEKLQNLYISYVFKAEKDIFEAEGLGEFLAMIKFTDNIPIIQLLDKPPNGIFHLIDSVGKMAADDGKDDAKLMDQIRKNHEANKITFYFKMNPEKFGIKHTAKDVTYYSPGFIDKNKDELPGNLLTAIDKGNKVIVRLFNKKLTDDEVLAEKVNNPMEKFLGYKFRQNMQELMDELMSCECNFVRCIKPNEAKKKDYWVPELALKQIKYLGVLDSIKVRRDSLPVRRKYEDFYAKYQDLDDISEERNVPYIKLKDKNPDWKKLGQNAVKSADKNPKPDDVLFGRNLVFMSVIFQNRLEEILEAKQKVKRMAVDKLSKAYKVFNLADKWEVYRQRTVKVVILAKNLFQTWNSKIEYIKFKRSMDSVRQVQRNFRQTVYKRNIRWQKFTAIVIGRSYRLFKIKEILFGAKKIVSVINRCARKIMFRAFMAKLRINKRAVNDVFERAWAIIEEKMKLGASLTIERIFRGHKDRINSTTEVERLKVIKEEVKRNKAATAIQKMSKGFIVRTRMDRLNRAAGFIQGYTRMLWLSKYFQEMKTAARKIQRATRKYLLKSRKTDERMTDFLVSSKQYVANLRVVEHDIIFKQKDSFDDIKNIENYTKVKYFEDEKSFLQSIPTVNSFVPEPPNIDLNPKMRMFSILIDFDCQVDTSDIYENSWAVDFLNFFQNVKHPSSRLLQMDVGESFTFALTDDHKLYSWGLNDYCQLARRIVPTMTHNEPGPCKIFADINPRVISSGDEHTIMVDYSNEVYAWGGNMAGQLGVGHSREPRSVIKLTSLKQNVKYVASKGRKSYLVTNDGKLYSWPNKDVNHKFVPAPVRVSEPNVMFSQVSCGQNFAIALTTNGLLYSFGVNHSGQLGLGDTRDRDSFYPIDSLRDYGEKTVEISCGHQHAACKTATGKVFTWGSGAQGQLGIGTRKNATRPVLVKAVEATVKAKSVQAGYYCSYILFENRKIYQAGSIASTNTENVSFRPFNYESKVFGGGKIQDEFTPLKLYTKWSKSITVTYLVVADFRDVQQSKNIRDKIAMQVNSKWEESYNQVLPPYDETVSKFICPRYVRKINTERGLAATTRSSLIAPDAPLGNGTSGSLGGTSSPSKKFSESAYQKSQRTGKAMNDYPVQAPTIKTAKFDDSLQNLTETNRKLEQLMHKPKSQWTAEDKKLIALTKSLK